MTHGTMGAAATLAVVLVAGPSVRPEAPSEVSFELHQGHLIVAKGSIGPLEGLNLLIDTGTIPSMVDHGIARKLRLPTSASELVAFAKRMPTRNMEVEGFRIGALSSGRVPAGVGDLSYLRGVRIDAIVGLDVLARTSFAIDYEARVLTFARRGQWESSAQLEVIWPFVAVRITAAGREVRLLVDTGSPDLVLFTTRVTGISKAPWRGDKWVHYASGPARLRRLELRDVSLGTDRWDALPAWALDREPDGYPAGIDGVLGVMSLGVQRTQFDFSRGELGWSR